MSRILRRPMFRGGRVDARGTGIASGLGYQKGGRVNYQMGGNVRGGIVNLPGGYFQTANERMEEWKKGLNNPYKETPITLQDKIDAYTPSETPDWFYPKIDYRTGRERRPPFPADLPGMSFPRDAEAMGVSEEIVSNNSEQNGSNKLTEGDGLPEKTKAEKLEEYQKMFEEAYGTGRGEDISNMLLSFAGKALKPEATVKSSFGEFFEDEAKRPSESKKYKDAATTAAINAFLTGEKTMAEVETYLAKVTAGKQIEYDLAKKIDKDMSLTDYVRTYKKSGDRVSQVLESGIRSKIQNFPEKYKSFKKIKSKHNTEDLLDEEYLGMIFWDEGTEEIFAVVMGAEGKPIKEPLY